MDEKQIFISVFFDYWQERLLKIKKLLNEKEYYQEAILLLCCYISAFAADRFPLLQDGESFKKLVQEYSGEEEFISQIDLLFFYKFPNSEYWQVKPYKNLKEYEKIKNILINNFGDESQIRKNRFVNQQEIMTILLSANKSLDAKNLATCLPLFSIGEILYRYVRCHAVHRFEFPLINECVYSETGEVFYEDNHILTGDKLYKIVDSIMAKLKEECLLTNKSLGEYAFSVN